MKNICALFTAQALYNSIETFNELVGHPLWKNLVMDNAHGQREYTPESDENALISYEYTNQYLKTKGLGNYAKDIYQHLCYNLERAEQQGTFVDKDYAFITLRNLATDKQRELIRKRELENKLMEGAKAQTQNCQIDCPQEIVSQTELIEIAEQAIEKLELRKRMVLRLRLFPDYKFTFSEIAGIIGYSESMARIDYKKAIQPVIDRINHKDEK